MPPRPTTSSSSGCRGAACRWQPRWRRPSGAPLDILVVGKVGVPGHEELALAAVADDGTVVVNAQVQAATGL